ncbi:hypothetical protein BVX94_01110 [bacterium B17]|nr:hypothetical protein BVX94_01110 [bacterium B17]
MMKRVLLLVLVLSLFAANAWAYPQAKMTVMVQDENGSPVVGAKAKAYYFEASSKHDVFTTDTNGQFVVQHQCMGSMGGSIEKEGYYRQGFGYGWKFNNVKGFMFKRFQPWNPTVTVVMKKKRNPVPMIMKYTDWMNVPAYEKPVAYDFEIGDWVAPYGQGAVSDFVFNFTGFDKGRGNAKLQCNLSFSNEKDGIQVYEHNPEDKSEYKWPFEAPESGYESSLMRFSSYLPGQGPEKNADNERKLIVRVRTKVDKNGKIISANYGKIYRDIQASWNGKIRFRYWFNQHGTRNLEDDPKKNIELKRDWR